MTDVHSPEQRSRNMAAIRSHGNARTELRLIALMKQHHLTGWRRRWPLPGHPDFAFPKQRVAVFVDGCFWHRCPRHFQAPRQRADFWEAKISRNVARDREVNRLLKARGWRVVRIWEHVLRETPGQAAARLRRALDQ